MGLAVGLSCWRAGFRVRLYDCDSEKLGRALHDLKKMDQWMAAEFPKDEPTYGECNLASDLMTLDRDADLVLECIPENMAMKVALWRSLAGAASRGAIFCSATSGLSISEMGKLSGFSAQ